MVNIGLGMVNGIEWDWMMIKVSRIASTLSPMPQKKNMKQWIWGCILCSWQKRPFFCMEAGDPIEIQPEMWSFGPVSNFDYPNTCFCNSYIRQYIAIRDAKISPCFFSAQTTPWPWNTSIPSHPIAGPSRSAGSGASAGIAAPARRHAERSERAGCGLAISCPGGSSPVLSTNLFIIKPGGILNFAKLENVETTATPRPQGQSLQPLSTHCPS